MITIFLYDYGYQAYKYGFLSWLFQRFENKRTFNICVFVIGDEDGEFQRKSEHRGGRYCSSIDVIKLDNVKKEELNVPKLYNMGLKKYQNDSDICIFAQPDILFESSFLFRYMSFFEKAKLPYSVIGRYSISEKLESKIPIPEKHHFKRNFDWIFNSINIGVLNPITWGCIVGRTKHFIEVGGFDTELPIHWESDIDRRMVDYSRLNNLNNMSNFRFYNIFYGLSLIKSKEDAEYQQIFSSRFSTECFEKVSKKNYEKEIILEQKLISY